MMWGGSLAGKSREREILKDKEGFVMVFSFLRFIFFEGLEMRGYIDKLIEF